MEVLKGRGLWEKIEGPQECPRHISRGQPKQEQDKRNTIYRVARQGKVLSKLIYRRLKGQHGKLE